MAARNSQQRAVSLRVKPVTAAVAVALGTLSTPLFAVEQISARDEIVVNATRRETTAQEVPINISAISGEQLKEYQISNLAEFSRWIPGLTLVDQGARNGSPIIIRGLNLDELDASEISVGNGGGGTVSTYYGEVPVYIDLKLVDMERVEVLRGPQGTLFGANSLAGTVRYIPKAPDTQNFSSNIYGNTFSMEQSDDPSYDVGITLNAPIVQDKLAFRGTLAYEDRAGFIDYNYLVKEPGVSNPEPDFDLPASDPDSAANNLTAQKDANDAQTTVARLALLWDITDRVQSTLSYHYQKREIGGRQVNTRESMSQIEVGGAPLDTGNYVSGYRVIEPIERENQIFELDVVADLGFAELTSATGYTTYDEAGQRDQTDILLDLSLKYGYTYTEFPSFTAYTRDTRDQTRLTQEFRLVSPADGGRIDWIAGAFYRDQQFEQDSLEFTPKYPQWLEDNGFIPAGSIPADYSDLEYAAESTDEIEEIALFGEIGLQLSDNWHATLGARYFDIDNASSGKTAFPIADCYSFCPPIDDPPFFNESEPVKQSWNDTIFKFNAAYNFTDNKLGYFTISEGFREGGSNAIAECDDNPSAAVCISADQKLYTPDKTTNYEVGYKSTWLDNSLVLNAAVFYIDWEDPQLTGFSEQGQVPITVNGNGATTQGIELEASWWITDQWAVRAAYAYSDAALSEDGPGPWEIGDRLPGSPRNQGSFGVRFLQPFSNGWELLVDYGLTSQSDVFTRLGEGEDCCRDGGPEYPPGEVLPGFTLHFASVTLSGDVWSAALYAENLTDKFAVTGVRQTPASVTRTGFGAPNGDGFAIRRYANYVVTPRTIGLDLRYRFE